MEMSEDYIDEQYNELPNSDPPPNFDEAEVMVPLDEQAWSDPWGDPYTLINAYEPRPQVEYLIPELIKKPSLIMGYGAPGSLKTLFVQSLCLSVAGNKTWLAESSWKPGGPTFTVNQYPVMFIDFDNGPEIMHERIESLSRALELDPETIPFYYYSFPHSGFDAGKELHIGELILRIRKHNIGMVWFDNLGVIKGSASENTDEMIPIMNNLRQVVVETGVVLGLIHHQSKTKDFKRRSGESIRGHSSIEGSLDLALMIERDEYGDNLVIKPTKTRGAMAYPFGAEFTYTWKPGTHDLETAKFYSLQVEDKYSDKAIDDAIMQCLDNKKLNKTQLVYATKEKLPDIGTNRIRERIDHLATSNKLIEKPGERTAKMFELP